MPHSCKRCGKEYSSAGNLRQHLRRKNPCEPTVSNVSVEDCIAELSKRDYNKSTYDCEHCGKQFNTYQSRWRHMKSCKALSEVSNQKDVEIQKLIERIEELERHQTQPTTNITNNTTNNIKNTHNNIHIHVRDFGEENISYLPKELLSHCFVTKDIVRLLKKIHCDKEHPENHNIRVKSQKRNQIETREDNRWMIKDEDDALTDCIQNGYRILVRHGFRHKNEIIDEELDKNEDEYYNIRDWLENVYDNQVEQKPIKRRLLLLLLNNQALLLGKEDE
jgi:hypothetical protein